MGDITNTEIENKWQELNDILSSFKKHILQAGEVVCFLLDNDPEAREKFRMNGISPIFYTNIEKVGRGTLLPELAQYGCYSRLPLDQQRLVVSGGVTAVIEKADGSFDTVKVDVLRAPSDVKMLVMAGDHLRTPEEQRRLIERSKKPAITADKACVVPWRVVGKVIEFRTGCVMTRADMLSALKALES